MSVFILTFIKDYFVSLFAFGTLSWLKVIVSTIGVTSSTQAIFKQVATETIETFFVVIFQTIFNDTIFVFIEFERVFALPTVFQISLQASWNKTLILTNYRLEWSITLWTLVLIIIDAPWVAGKTLILKFGHEILGSAVHTITVFVIFITEFIFIDALICLDSHHEVWVALETNSLAWQQTIFKFTWIVS